MRRWRSHKIVEAEKITRAGYDLHGVDQGWVFEFEDGEHENVGIATWNRCVKMAWAAVERGQHPEREPDEHPGIGGYFVRYEDGYTSWSPAKAFEEGYIEVGSVRRAVVLTIEQAKALEELVMLMRDDDPEADDNVLNGALEALRRVD